jgi:predicted flap endonuclease-1-like 5' DNA nuclease
MLTASSLPSLVSVSSFESFDAAIGSERALMTYSIIGLNGIDGIAPGLSAKLKSLGIRTTDKLLECTKGLKERQELARKIDIDPAILLSIANLSDRMRIKGVGEEYAELLRAAGVDTVKELRYRNPANLAKKMAQANAERNLVRVLPSPPMIERWIEHARKLPLKISY